MTAKPSSSRTPSDAVSQEESIAKSDIGPSWSKPLPDVARWASRMAVLARSKMTGRIVGRISPYRLAGVEYLTVDLMGQLSGDMSVTISTGSQSTDYSFDDLERTCFEVPDMTEGLTMISLFLRDANAMVSLGSANQSSRVPQQGEPVVPVIAAFITSVNCPICNTPQLGFIEDPRGGDFDCNDCGRPFHIPADSSVVFG